MKKLINWIKSPKSDFVLFIFLLVLLNLAGHKSFLRFDLTAPKSYSLSAASKSVVKNLQEPLSVRVFFDDNLPNQYNVVAQYVKDILTEYKGAANKNFTVSHMNLNDPKNVSLARDLGLQQIQIQEVKNNEVGFKQVYMGLVFSYGDAVEKLDGVTTIDGLEYKITSTISKMVNTVDALSGLGKGNKIKLTLYMSSVLKSFRISGMDQVEAVVNQVYKNVNKQNMDRIDFEVVNPTAEQVSQLADTYSLQTIGYKNSSNEKLDTLEKVKEHSTWLKVLGSFTQLD